MMVHLFHESLLHFIKSFYGAWSFLWEFVKSLECQINIYFLQTRLGVLCTMRVTIIMYHDLKKGKACVM